MTDSHNSILVNALSQPKDAVFFSVSQALAELFPERVVVETEEKNFNLVLYSWAKLCDTGPKEDVHSQWTAHHYPAKKSIYSYPKNTWQKVKWLNHEFDLLTVTISGTMCDTARHFVVGPNQEVTEHFVFACCEWNSVVRGEILVFSGGWSKDEELFMSIQNTTLDTLMLEQGLKEEIAADFTEFFETKDLYLKHNIPWKRGVLFLGPPGNGKTHAIKGLVNLLKKPCLYVRTMKHRHQTDQEMIEQVFRRAREAAPCVLIFEDLDSLLDNQNRAFFLNELDGFASNDGIMTIATTNHPERLDPAIIHRPSRFDRKYTFHLPSEEERVRYLQLQNGSLGIDLKLSESEIQEMAQVTSDFSFAYLKELVLSSMMKWLGTPTSPMVEVMRNQLDALKMQMQTPSPEPQAVPAGEDYLKRWRR